MKATKDPEIRRDLTTLAEELRFIGDYLQNLSDIAEPNELQRMMRQGDITQMKIRVGQIKFRLKLS